MQMSRAEGALLGLAVGDALGVTTEFSRNPGPPFPSLALGPHREIRGGGQFRLLPGQVSDDTQIAAASAMGLKERGAFAPEDVAQRYVAWKAHAFDIGVQTSAVLSALARGASVREAAR